MRKTTTEKITGIQEQIQQLENQRKRLVKQHNEEERRKRTHRICKRGGLLESLLPETIPLTDEQFKSFLEKTLLGTFARKTLDSLTSQDDKTIPKLPTKTTENTSTTVNDDVRVTS